MTAKENFTIDFVKWICENGYNLKYFYKKIK